jgi:integrase
VDQPIKLTQLKRPPRHLIRKAREEKELKMFEAKDLRTILEKLNVQLRAMALLAVNCGLGNGDCGRLKFRHLDLSGGWLNYPRPKTGVARRAKLWQETIDAIEAAGKKPSQPKRAEFADLVFLTREGDTWYKVTKANPIGNAFRWYLHKLKLHRPGVGFYALRHTFETIAGASKDQVAVDHIMGHSRDDMASVYRERIDDDRLVAVAEYVRKWLFPPEEEQEANATPKKPGRKKSAAKKAAAKKAGRKKASRKKKPSPK